MIGELPAPETRYEGDWLRVVRRGKWEYAERTHGAGMAVVIVAVTPGDGLLFVEQFRVPTGSRTIELPAGLVGDLDQADTFEDATRRELVEETGWEAAGVERLVVGPTSPGMSNERAAFLRASCVWRVGPGGGVENEDSGGHEGARGAAAAWLARKSAEGCEVDLKAWAGLWLATHAFDGTELVSATN